MFRRGTKRVTFLNLSEPGNKPFGLMAAKSPSLAQLNLKLDVHHQTDKPLTDRLRDNLTLAFPVIDLDDVVGVV